MDEQSSLISRVSALFARGAVSYCSAGGVAGLIGIGLTLLLLFGISAPDSTQPWDPLTVWRSMTAGEKVILISGLLLASWLPVLLGARGVCRITFELLASSKPSPARILVDMARFLPAAIAYSLLIGVPVLVASAFLYLPGLVFAAFFTLVIPAGINEGWSFLWALRRGFSLSGKIYGKILLTVVVSVVLVGVAVALRITLLDSLISGPQTQVLVIRMALILVPGLLVLILANIGFTLLYVEAVETETLDSTQNRAAASGGS